MTVADKRWHISGEEVESRRNSTQRSREMGIADIYWPLSASLLSAFHMYFIFFLTLISHFHFTIEDNECPGG